MILSSAKYSLASAQVGVSVRVTFLKNSSKGFPWMASQRKIEYAPGNTYVKPKKDSQALSGVWPILYSKNWAA